MARGPRRSGWDVEPHHFMECGRWIPCLLDPLFFLGVSKQVVVISPGPRDSWEIAPSSAEVENPRKGVRVLVEKIWFMLVHVGFRRVRAWTSNSDEMGPRHPNGGCFSLLENDVGLRLGASFGFGAFALQMI